MNISIIASYPKQSEIHGTEVVGVASYTKSLITALKKTNPTSRIKVFAERLGRDASYTENNIAVLRSWERNNPVSLLKTLLHLKKDPAGTVLMSFEINMFGNFITTALTLLGISLLRLSGKRTITIMHQVVQDFAPLEKNKMKQIILNTAKNIFYHLVSTASTKIIVFEQSLKDFLGEKIGTKTVVIPHAIFTQKKIAKDKARIELGFDQKKTYTLYFGFISPYKGIEKLVDAWPVNESTELIIAGGINPNHTKNKKITEYIASVTRKAEKKDIKITGFVPEDLLPLYFSAADVIALPYETFFSSSGPLALTLAYEKPFLISQALSEYSKTADFSNTLKNTSLTIQDLIVKLTPEKIDEKITWAAKNTSSFKAFSEGMLQSRSFAKVSSMYWDALK